MSPEAIISSIHYKKVTSSQVREPRARFVQYFKDLYTHLGRDIDESSFTEGSQVTYSELGEAVLSECSKSGVLNNLDLMVAAYWAYEFDPDHASCGAYWSEKFKLNCRMFDVCEQGTIAPFTAIKIIDAFLNNNEEVKKALLLILEQTTIPRQKSDCDLIPAETGAISIVLEKNLNKEKRASHLDQYHIARADIIPDYRMMRGGCEVVTMLCEEYLPKSSQPTPINLYLRKNSYLWQVVQYALHTLPEGLTVKPFSSQAGSIQPWQALYEAINSQTVRNDTKPTLILVDQDVESLNAGILILQPTIARG